MNFSEREETTRYAIKTIDSCLKRGEYTSALLLAFIYANIRLRTMMTEYLSPTKNKWKTTHAVLGRLPFSGLLNECKKVGILTNSDVKKLNQLRKKRNEIAHESELWKHLTTDDIKAIKQNCKFLKIFLQKTTKSRV